MEVSTEKVGLMLKKKQSQSLLYYREAKEQTQDTILAQPMSPIEEVWISTGSMGSVGTM